MAAAKKDKTKEVPVNSKGFRKNYKSGVVGWQVMLKQMRFFVNLNQHAKGIGASSGLLKASTDGIKNQDKVLAKQLVKVPARLAKRRVMALKNGMVQHESGTSDFFKELRKFTDLILIADKKVKTMMVKDLTVIVNALNKAKEKIPGRLNKKIKTLQGTMSKVKRQEKIDSILTS